MSAAYDLVVVGGGVGGISAVRTAHRAGKKALLISDGPPGGDCTFTGCVPSKALLAQAKAGASVASALEHVRRSIETIAAAESSDVLRGEGIDVIEGRAELLADKRVVVGGDTFSADNIVLATGASPLVPPIPGLLDSPYLTNETVFAIDRAPATLGVLGGGAIGCELAFAFAQMGVRVTIFEAMDRLLAREEPEASDVVAQALRAAGVDVRVGQKVTNVRPDGTRGAVCLKTEDGAEVAVERLLVAVGRTPNTAGLGLDAAGVELTDRGAIATNDRMRTNVDGIYAVGDVTMKLPFTHAADEMGRLAVGNMFKKGLRGDFRTKWIPWVTFTDPEVARVGVTEADAASMRGKVAYLPMSEMDRAITDGRTEGFIKIIAGPKRLTRGLYGGQIIGATIVAPRAGEMIGELALAMRTGMFTGRIGQTVHAYPTWSYGIQKAVGQFFFEIDGRSARKAKK